MGEIEFTKIGAKLQTTYVAYGYNDYSFATLDFGVVENGFVSAINWFFENCELYLNLDEQPNLGTVSDYSESSFGGQYYINTTAYYPFNYSGETPAIASNTEAYYPFVGDYTDLSENNNDLMATGTITLVDDRFGNSNNACEFTSGNLHKNVFSLDNFDTKSQLFTIRYVPHTSPQTLSIYETFSYFYIMSDGTLRFLIGGTPGAFWDSTTSLTSGEYHQVGFRINNTITPGTARVLGDVDIFIDGIKETCAMTSTGTSTTVRTKLQFGAGGTSSLPLKGSMDDALITDNTITDNGFLNLYNISQIRNLTTADISNPAADGSVNSNDGVVTGATLTTDRFGNEDSAYTGDTAGQEIDFPMTLGGSDKLTVVIITKMNKGATDSAISKLSSSIGSSLLYSYNEPTWSPGNKNAYQWAIKKSGVTKYSGTDILDEYDVYHTLGVVWDGTTVKRYVDGVQTASNTISSGNIDTFTTKNLYQTGKPETDDEIIILNNVALTDDDMLNLYNATSEHKLDNPLVTKTDVNSNTITGYEFWGQSTGSEDNGTYLDVNSTVNEFDSGDMTFYQEVLLNHLPSNSSFSMNHYNWNFYHTNSALVFSCGRMNDASGPTYTLTMSAPVINTIYKTIGYYHPDASGGNGYMRLLIYSNNILVKDETVSIGSDIIYTAYGTQNLRISKSNHGVNTMFNGVVTKPMIFNKILDDDETNKILNIDSVDKNSANLSFDGGTTWQEFEDGQKTTLTGISNGFGVKLQTWSGSSSDNILIKNTYNDEDKLVKPAINIKFE